MAQTINPPLANGEPMVQITGEAKEVIPTGQYANVTVGPISVTRWVHDADRATIKESVNEVQELVEEVVAEQRELVLESVKSG